VRSLGVTVLRYFTVYGTRQRPEMAIHAPRGGGGDVQHTVADISAARAALGYAPEVDLREGIARFVA
jgi:nucleoside-diphosphate-sugar epimerase